MEDLLNDFDIKGSLIDFEHFNQEKWNERRQIKVKTIECCIVSKMCLKKVLVKGRINLDSQVIPTVLSSGNLFYLFFTFVSLFFFVVVVAILHYRWKKKMSQCFLCLTKSCNLNRDV